MPLSTGLYEQLITKLLNQQLSELDPKLSTEIYDLDEAESHHILAHNLSLVIMRSLKQLKGKNKLSKQIQLSNKIICQLQEFSESESLDLELVEDKARQLVRIHDPAFKKHPKPETPLTTSSLLTATQGDPSLVSQLKKEIVNADRVDILVSFIKWSGIRILQDELIEFTKRHPLRVITTSYMGATDLKAIEFLLNLDHTEVKVSYDTRRTRLHAKAYIFHRNSGFGTAYIGSSNISNPAMTDGLEWNVKICQYENIHLWNKIVGTFETYQNSRDFKATSLSDLTTLSQALSSEKHFETPSFMTFFDIKPYGFQQEILDKMLAERINHHRHKNLVVAATGTGKTVIAAFDYKQHQQSRKHSRLLFVAHREEILKQSRNVFRSILRDQNFGELWVGSHKPSHREHLFVSIQTLQSQQLWQTVDTDFYDYIVIDEFHHAAAPSYQKLLCHFQPNVLLGLTATPERMDGQDVTQYFDHRICAEIRLPDAINRKLLSPFQYFCITDTVNYSKLKWSRGGYDIAQLDNLITGNDMRAQLVISKMQHIILDVKEARGLCFCVSQKHAHYMAKKLNESGIPAQSITAETPDRERKAARDKLRHRDVNFLCVVDIFNEGVDIPEIDVVVFLRPTESLTIFLQQLGRGLRLSDGKENLTVLDFVGQAHNRFNYEVRFRSLLGRSKKPVEDEIENAFPSLPSGCVIEMEKEARHYILGNIKKALSRATKNQLVQRIATFERETDAPLTLVNFMTHHNLDLDTIYKKSSWSRLCSLARAASNFHDPDEKQITKGLRRFAHHTSVKWLNILRKLLSRIQNEADITLLSRETQQFLTMCLFTVWNNQPPEQTLFANLERLRKNKRLYEEFMSLIEILMNHSDSLTHDPELPFACPLNVHALYTRNEILAGLGTLTISDKVNMREGVKHLSNINTDIFLITLDKSEKDYSPTTMYNDYALNDVLFHWQSQSTTSDTSPTGQRYINHQRKGSHVLLFVREFKKVNGLTPPYYFLGPATYVSHEGSRPMSIVWKLKFKMPGRLVRTTARLEVA